MFVGELNYACHFKFHGQVFVFVGGGANIGAGLMILYSPIAYIAAISIGWAIGELFHFNHGK